MENPIAEEKADQIVRRATKNGGSVAAGLSSKVQALARGLGGFFDRRVQCFRL
jgi:hypothetical protein